MSRLIKQISEAPIVLVIEAGVPYRPDPTVDSITAFVELMEVVEALCPKWPPRLPSRGHDYRL